MRKILKILTEIHLATFGGHLIECKLIMANIDDLQIKNLQDQTPMDIAKEDNHVHIIQLFRLAAI